MRISDWSSDVCSSDLRTAGGEAGRQRTGRKAKTMQRRPPPASVTSALAFLLSVLFSLPAAADLRGHGGFVKGVAVSPDGRRVLSASFDYSLILWDLGAQADLAHLVEHEGSVNAVAFLPDGARKSTRLN